MTRTSLVSLCIGLLQFLAGPALSASPPDSQHADFGKAKLEIPVGSRWVVVRGKRGDTVITEGQAVFEEGNQVKISWKGTFPSGSRSSSGTVEYQLDPKPDPPRGFPFLVPRDSRARVRVIGKQLLFEELADPWSGFTLVNPPADLFLLLKPAVK
jgi:hypothetical protein